MPSYADKIKALLTALTESSLSDEAKHNYFLWATGEISEFKLSAADNAIILSDPPLLKSILEISIIRKQNKLKDVSEEGNRLMAAYYHNLNNKVDETLEILERQLDLFRIEIVLIAMGILDKNLKFRPCRKKKHKQIIVGVILLLIKHNYFKENLMGKTVSEKDIYEFFMKRYTIDALQETRRDTKKYMAIAESEVTEITQIELEKTKHRPVYTFK